MRYLTSKREFLRYDQALAAGWPIATRAAEGGNHSTQGHHPGCRGPSRARRRTSRAHIITTSPGADSR